VGWEQKRTNYFLAFSRVASPSPTRSLSAELAVSLNCLYDTNLTADKIAFP